MVDADRKSCLISQRSVCYIMRCDCTAERVIVQRLRCCIYAAREAKEARLKQRDKEIAVLLAG